MVCNCEMRQSKHAMSPNLSENSALASPARMEISFRNFRLNESSSGEILSGWVRVVHNQRLLGGKAGVDVDRMQGIVS